MYSSIVAPMEARLASPADQAALRQAIIAAEDARGLEPADLQPLIDGAKSNSPETQQLAVRALGRLERESVVPNILPSLTSTSPVVRAEAANALAQAVQGPGTHDVSAVARPLRERLGVETNPTVRGVIYEALGRLPYGTSAEVRDAETVLLDGTGGGKDPALETQLGTLRGVEALFRIQAKKGPAGTAAVERLRALVRSAKVEGAGKAHENATRVRRLAVAALQAANAADLETLRVALKDPDTLVRREAASFVDSRGRPFYADTVVKDLLPIISEAIRLQDKSPLVRYEVVAAYGTHLREQSCAPLIDATGDASVLVAQTAIDALGRGCPAAGDQDKAVAALRRLADTLPAADAKPSATTHRVEWHRAAHALVSLASIAPDQAKAILPTFLAHSVWQVRMYAARAATTLQDATTLRTLAEDTADNVRSAAITGLSRVTTHADDAVFIAALGRSDHQVIQVAARALQGTSNKSAALPAFLAALGRFTAEKKDNTRDARVAILQRVRELGSSEQAADLTPYLKDFDPRIATLAAEAVTAWGAPSTASPVRPKTVAPNFAEVMKLQSARVRIAMKTGGSFELRLFPAEAPATVDRFVRLARAGYYNGLTFHRVAPNWVIQGGSPGANEVTGDSPFMVDEVGLRSHTRGALGISTRGHDTGDAQLFVDLCDNVSLDHGFGVWGEVTKGMDVVDGVIEGDAIDRIEITVAPSKGRTP
jgi:cyclophilin family peptidyl-prolyl cis-trans isomerase